MNIAGTLFILVLLAIITEEIVDGIKATLPIITKTAEKVNSVAIIKIISFLVALLLTAGANVDLFNLLKIEYQIPYVGLVFSAWIVSRGSNGVHRFIDLIEGLIDTIKSIPK